MKKLKLKNGRREYLSDSCLPTCLPQQGQDQKDVVRNRGVSTKPAGQRNAADFDADSDTSSVQVLPQSKAQPFLTRDFVAVRNFENKVTKVPTLDIAGLNVKNYHQARIYNNNMDLQSDSTPSHHPESTQ